MIILGLVEGRTALTYSKSVMTQFRNPGGNKEED